MAKDNVYDTLFSLIVNNILIYFWLYTTRYEIYTEIEDEEKQKEVKNIEYAKNKIILSIPVFAFFTWIFKEIPSENSNS